MTMDVEEVLTTSSEERRVDMPKLLLYLAKMEKRLTDLEQSLVKKIEQDKEFHSRISEVLDMLTQAKGAAVFVRWFIAVSVGLATFIFWVKEHFKW